MSQSYMYRTIVSVSEGIYKEKGSKFLAFAIPVSSEEEAKRQLDDYKKTYKDARHICYAFSVKATTDLYRYSDAGEPAGTAGKPIYGQLLSFELNNVLLIVVRYFGGVKLGRPGLIQAYKEAAREALEQANKIEKEMQAYYQVVFEYASMNSVMRVIKEMQLHINKQEFDLHCSLEVSVPLSLENHLVTQLRKIEGLSWYKK